MRLAVSRIDTLPHRADCEDDIPTCQEIVFRDMSNLHSREAGPCATGAPPLVDEVLSVVVKPIWILRLIGRVVCCRRLPFFFRVVARRKVFGIHQAWADLLLFLRRRRLWVFRCPVLLRFGRSIPLLFLSRRYLWAFCCPALALGGINCVNIEIEIETRRDFQTE